jgi:hypothetical protein
MARNLPELIFFISIVASWNYFEPGPFNSLITFGISMVSVQRAAVMND